MNHSRIIRSKYESISNDSIKSESFTNEGKSFTYDNLFRPIDLLLHLVYKLCNQRKFHHIFSLKGYISKIGSTEIHFWHIHDLPQFKQIEISFTRTE